MSAIKVYGSMLSPAVMRVMACLNEKELKFQFVEVNMGAGEHKKEPFISLNPFGLVPAFEDGDLKLFESRAITRYIANQYEEKGTNLVINGKGKQMASFVLCMEVEAHQFDPPASKLAFELVIKAYLGMTTDETVVEESKVQFAKVLDVYEARLSESKYLAGDEFTLVDLHHFPNLHYLMSSPIKKMFESRPHFLAWCTAILARPSSVKVLEMQKAN
ncbi:Glutathione s-transferase [Thalictrum thalictroides]|uniref:glutathione transferase n=1 Tax=Thalictrum thalictroides TaxID=46969 RepID=A0A7J6V1S9_THATH|nr:Glutathione s-transferase [Thalictrum thalictroides]